MNNSKKIFKSEKKQSLRIKNNALSNENEYILI